jgi:deoxycytidylate deaminase
MGNGMDLEAIYSLRKNFTIIGLTGRTGAGCTEVASIIKNGFDEHIFPKPTKPSNDSESDDYRKYKIVYNYAKNNFRPYKIIEYRHILTYIILMHPFKELVGYLNNPLILRIVTKYFKNNNLKKDELISYKLEIEELEKLKNDYDIFHDKVHVLEEKIKNRECEELYQMFYSLEFINFSNNFHKAFRIESAIKHNKIFQLISNSLRRESIPYSVFEAGKRKTINANNIYFIAKVINNIVKSIYEYNQYHNEPTGIVIDSLRNPLEIMYFKEKYSIFYMAAVNRDQRRIEDELIKRFYGDKEFESIQTIELEEHKKEENHEFFKQDVSECIQRSDIHLEYITELEIEKYKKQNLDIPSNISIEKQNIKYIALIGQPGIITPSAEERCMQIAYTAKYNSGCLSRQVGALITDEHNSIKAVGWNDVAEGQVSCALRSVDDYLYQADDYDAYSDYEKNDPKFIETVKKYYKNKTKEYAINLNGRNVCFCFKTLHNLIKSDKNQIHVRALHAEENAFLQIVKYGGQGISKGKLFSTASPCELCSKKAYQLNIEDIYYIDPYPGIATEQILKSGIKNKRPQLHQFIGAIGKAYHKFYEPFLSYKDELSLLLDIDFRIT